LRIPFRTLRLKLFLFNCGLLFDRGSLHEISRLRLRLDDTSNRVIFLLVIELWRPSGIGFDTPLFWIPVAMINFLRLRNGYRSFQGLRTFAILANLMVLLLEIIRLGEWGVWVLGTGACTT
jgi:hypothetical protein